MISIHSISLSLLLISVLQSQYTSTEAFAAKSKSRSSGGGFGVKKESPLTHTPDTSETTQALLQFLKAEKAKGLPDVEIGNDANSGVRGLFATKNFKKGQLMCQIPSGCALALSDPSKNGDDTPTSAHGGANFLSMYVHDPQAKQVWAPYLDTLPQQGTSQFDPTPDFFDDEELELLEFPRVIQLAKSRKEEIAKLAAEKGLDLSELQFATWLTTSRAFTIKLAVESEEEDKAMLEQDTKAESSSEEEEASEGEKQTIVTKAEAKVIRVMVPFIDMANHNSDQANAKLTLVDPEKDDAWFALEATRPIKAGKEIVIAYGTGVESSVELFLNYGFVPKINNIDGLMLEKGGDDAITSLDGWTTSLEEDQSMLGMAEGDPTLQKILNFRIRLKESYK
eukprot:CAMPEP_0113640520 /NCGR_PEP_ID=MMETSP0017_2-20120614/21269_1 /TAXON_ID=2856 /ORGANISM="Cylindrotheca closterium" /LENGTH=394 /DNA_ID=CAMNT_0000551811 /DNA_START=1 /DNA_END=1185 /DNA_ORIENTATION=- /assembly_acc=CAM_ASM_000147